ncbi:HK97 family phage prohead protease [Novosphingobium sp. BW1]|uniref:HK97 family phage prohead protease n=1 Tax=Novosphingobium sp. BW1 TaxID=2592621 RepID=UPI0011DE6A1D|nr:HK97 family phage prohead protease [Novosphingobium sp. BW1]TYC93552.1 hypothetical protein FMM79_01240 [Novosphingobium sp. BW1]
MNVKSLTIERMNDAGSGRARIAQLSAVDSDGDTYAPGAFSWGQGGGQWCQILPAHNRKAMPLGKAWIYEENGWAVADLYLNLNTQAGKDWHETLKFDLAKGKPVQEWSYGYAVLDADHQQREGRNVQVLKKLDVDEISPVIRGAGIGTGTLSIKSDNLRIADEREVIAALGAWLEWERQKHLQCARGVTTQEVQRLVETGVKQGLAQCDALS